MLTLSDYAFAKMGFTETAKAFLFFDIFDPNF